MSTNDINKKIKTFLPLLVLFVLIVPVLTSAQTQENPIIPCTNDCDFEDLLTLVDNIIDWIIKIAIPVSAGVFAWAGIKYMTTGVSDQKSEAKAMMFKVFKGLVFILAAWIIVSTILDALLSQTFRNTININ